MSDSPKRNKSIRARVSMSATKFAGMSTFSNRGAMKNRKTSALKVPTELTTTPKAPKQPALGGGVGLIGQKTAVILVDPQIDFTGKGDMGLPRAGKTNTNIAQLLSQFSDNVDDIYVSLRNYPTWNISFNTFWIFDGSETPEPFTLVSKQDVESGKYVPVFANLTQYVKNYFKSLEKSGIGSIVLFPEHCVVGSAGAAVDPVILKALTHWEKSNQKSVHFLPRCTNSKLVQHSIFKAVIGSREDPDSLMNKTFMMKLLTSYDKIVMVGNTVSHSIKFSINDMIYFCQNDKSIQKYARNNMLPPVLLLADLCGNVEEFNNSANYFKENLKTVKKDDYDEIKLPAFVVTNSSNAANVFESSGEVFGSVRKLTAGLEYVDPPAQTSLGEVDISNEEDMGNMGPGCYLLFSEKNFGSLSMVWSKVMYLAKDEGSAVIGYFRPAPGFQVPEFKFSKQGITVISREMNKGDGKRRNLFKGVLRFIQDCKNFNGTFVLRNNSELVGEEFSVFGLSDGGKMQVFEEGKINDPNDATVLSCIPKVAGAYRGVAKQNKIQFLETGDRIGATLEFR